MRKVFWVLSLVLVMALGLAAVAAAETGVTKDEIVIGSHQDLSGPLAGWGTQVKMGLELRAKQINDAGGIHGRKIRLVIEDSKYDPKTAIMVTNKMISRDKVFAFVGNLGSPTAGATKPIISRKKIPQMFPLTAASLFFEPYDRYSFGGFVPYYDQARVAVKYFVEKKGYKRIGLLYQDDEYGSIVKKGVEDQLAVYKMKLVGTESYKRGATQFSSQITKLRKADCQLVMLGTVIRETVGALKEAKKMSWNVDMCGLTPAHTKYIILLSKKAGFSAEGFYCGTQTPYIYADSPLPTVREWWKQHVAMFDKEPDMPTCAGWAGLNFFVEAAQKAGPDLTREKFVDTMETFRDFPDNTFGGSPITFTSTNHQGPHGVMMQYVEKDRFVTISDRTDY